MQQKTHRYIVFDREIKQPVALCFDQDCIMYVSSFTGEIFVVQLHYNLVSLKGTVKSSLQLGSKLLYGIISMNNVFYVSAHDGASIYNKVHSFAM